METTPNIPPKNREAELRVFNADTAHVRTALKELGAVSMGTMEFKRAVMDVIPVNPDKWIRVRTEGDTTTIAIKQRAHDEFGDHEVEVEVEDFDKALAMLEFLNGYIPRSEQESRREAYELNGAEVSIDSWPQIKDFIEIEALDSRFETVHETANLLGISPEELTNESVESFYKRTLGIDIKTTSLRFEVE